MKQKIVVWTKPSPENKNVVLSGKGFYLSFNPCIGDNPFDAVIEMLGQAESRVGKDETALRVDDDSEMGSTWYILNGDFREEYSKAFPDLKKCLAVYNKHKAEFRSGFSTDEL